MKFQLGALSVGDIMDRGVKLLFDRLGTFYVINLIVLAPLLVFQLALPLLLVGASTNVQLLILVLGAFLALVPSVFLAPIGTAAIIHVIAEEFVDRQASFWAALRVGLRHLWGLLLASVIYALLVIGSSLFCLVPGLYLMVLFGFYAQIIVVEKRPATDTFYRSQQLSTGYRWRILGIYLLVLILTLMAHVAGVPLQYYLPGFYPINTPQGGYEFHLHSYNNHVLLTVVEFLLTTLVQTYSAICTTLLYFDLRIRKEGYDLELAVQQSSG
jgi:hypothetical protein